MKGNLVSTIFTIIGTVLSGYLLYYLTQDKIELEYYLSEPIPLIIDKGEVKESVQQLTVINSGDVAIDSIGIKITGKIKEANVIKNFVDDKVVQNVADTFFQAQYSKLPPNSKFSYTIKSTVGGITSKLIDISYPKGKAINALEPANSSNATILIYVLCSVGYLIYIIISTFKGHVFRKLQLSSYDSILTVLNEPKPFYVNQKDWDEARRSFIKSKRDIKNFHCSNLQEHESFKILNSCKPEHVSDFEWSLIIDTMASHYEDLFLYKVKVSTDSDSLGKILNITKPINFIESKWNELNHTACKELFAVNNLEKYYVNENPASVAKILRKPPPKNVESEVWQDYIQALKLKYFTLILLNISEKLYPHTTELSDFDLDLNLLEKREKEKIEHFVYKLKLMNIRQIISIYDAKSFIDKNTDSDAIRMMTGTNYDFLNDQDRSKMEEIANAYIELDKNTTLYEKLLSNIESILGGSNLGEKPEELDDDSWSKLKEIEEKIITKSYDNILDRKQIDIDKSEISKMQARVVKQLSIISNVFSKPNSVLEIEDYDNPFAEGNYHNLKKVAEIIEQSR